MDHNVPDGEGGGGEIANAIAVCFECHAEIHSYNDRHPRGRKFHPEELKKHEEQWLSICRERPSELLAASRNADVGPLQALIDELAFNETVANANIEICPFMIDQMKRAITEGTLSVVGDGVGKALLTAYHQMSIANNAITRAASAPPGGYFEAEANAKRAVKSAASLIQAARETLLHLLNSE
jgi:hypothetical protein